MAPSQCNRMLVEEALPVAVVRVINADSFCNCDLVRVDVD
jgi:hypothetical protein